MCHTLSLQIRTANSLFSSLKRKIIYSIQLENSVILNEYLRQNRQQQQKDSQTHNQTTTNNKRKRPKKRNKQQPTRKPKTRHQPTENNSSHNNSMSSTIYVYAYVQSCSLISAVLLTAPKWDTHSGIHCTRSQQTSFAALKNWTQNENRLLRYYITSEKNARRSTEPPCDRTHTALSTKNVITRYDYHILHRLERKNVNT